MRRIAWTLTLLSVAAAAPAVAQTPPPRGPSMAAPSGSTGRAIGDVSPALDRYLRETVDGDLWRRPQLTPRDRSIVTLTVLISRNRSADLPAELRRALDNGVKPRELSEIITHLAFYSGLGDVGEAISASRQVFAERGIGPDQLPQASPQLRPVDRTADAPRAAIVARDVKPISPGLAQYTDDLLFNDLWLRPDLAPRDRSMVTVTSLMANGQAGQIAFHLNKAMDNGLTRDQVGEVVTQVAFYAGWPKAFSTMPVVTEVLRGRPQ